MIAVDTNILVYAHREDAPAHARALVAITSLAEGRSEWAIPWPSLHEFYGIVTHPRIYQPPSTGLQALAAISDLVQARGCRVVSEASDHFEVLSELLTGADIRGPKVHDARIAAICLSHGVRELWTADRDFSYFPRLRTRNPLV